MARLVVHPGQTLRAARIVGIMNTLIVLTVVAVLVVHKESRHIRLIVTQVNRSGTMVMVGIVVPIIRRTPRVVIICPPAGIDGRSAYKNGAHIVVRTIHIR